MKGGSAFEVVPGLLVGDLESCGDARGRWLTPSVLHACKHPCYVRARADLLAGSPLTGLRADDFTRGGPFYLAVDVGPDLYLNLIDPPTPLFQAESFHRALRWLDRAMEAGPTLVHCNQGASRAPSIALLWLARRGALPAGSFEAARAAFVGLLADSVAATTYAPGAGIATFLAQHWAELVDVSRGTGR